MTTPTSIPTVAPAFTGIAGAAAYMGMSRNSIRRLIDSKALPATRLPTGSIRIRIAEVDAIGEPV